MIFPSSTAQLALSILKNNQILQKVWRIWRKIFQLFYYLNGRFWTKIFTVNCRKMCHFQKNQCYSNSDPFCRRGVYDQCRKFFWKYLIKRWNRSTYSAIRIRITIFYFTFLPLFSEHCVSGTWFPPFCLILELIMFFKSLTWIQCSTCIF